MAFSKGFRLPHRQPQMIQAKLLKADLHGAIISGNLSKSAQSLDGQAITRATSPVSGCWACSLPRRYPSSPAVAGDDELLSQVWPLLSRRSLCAFSTWGPLLVPYRTQQLLALAHSPLAHSPNVAQKAPFIQSPGFKCRLWVASSLLVISSTELSPERLCIQLCTELSHLDVR